MAKSRLLRLKDKSSHIYFDKNLLEDLTYTGGPIPVNMGF